MSTARNGLLALGPLLLCGAGSPPATPASISLPSWLLGTWTPVEIRENSYLRYVPGESPKEWYKNSDLTITPDRLAFYDDACVIGSVQTRHGPISAPIKGIAGGGPEDFDLPRERKPVNYFALKCAHSLFTRTLHIGAQDIAPHEITPAITWYIIVRSPTEIDMPFLGGSYIKFRKLTPTS